MIHTFEGADNGFLSNFYACEIRHKGITYPSVEHAYQAQKAKSNADRHAIAQARTAAEAKRMGRRLNCRDDWQEVKVRVMLKLLRKKFKKGTRLGNMLQLTAGEILVEGNTWGDHFWGQTRGPTDSYRQGEGRGLNMLGVLLMIVRAEITGGF